MINQEETNDKDGIIDILKTLFINDKFTLPEAGEDDGIILNKVNTAASLALEKLGRPDLAGALSLSNTAIKFLKQNLKVDKCGANTKSQPPLGGKPIKQINGRETILYTVKYENNVPNLPKVIGPNGDKNEGNALIALQDGIGLWTGKLKLGALVADDPEDANLVYL